MGFNTVAVILNDQLHKGARDPHLGERIQEASRGWLYRDRDSLATHIGGSYGRVISQDHADGYQVVVVHGNTGWRVDDAEYDKYLGRQALLDMKECLERNGYRVTKKRPAPSAAPSVEG